MARIAGTPMSAHRPMGLAKIGIRPGSRNNSGFHRSRETYSGATDVGSGNAWRKYAGAARSRRRLDRARRMAFARERGRQRVFAWNAREKNPTFARGFAPEREVT